MKKATDILRSLAAVTPGMDTSMLRNAPVLDNVRKIVPEPVQHFSREGAA